MWCGGRRSRGTPCHQPGAAAEAAAAAAAAAGTQAVSQIVKQGLQQATVYRNPAGANPHCCPPPPFSLPQGTLCDRAVRTAYHPPPPRPRRPSLLTPPHLPPRLPQVKAVLTIRQCKAAHCRCCLPCLSVLPLCRCLTEHNLYAGAAVPGTLSLSTLSPPPQKKHTTSHRPLLCPQKSPRCLPPPPPPTLVPPSNTPPPPHTHTKHSAACHPPPTLLTPSSPVGSGHLYSSSL